jgi:hypothetical protein
MFVKSYTAIPVGYEQLRSGLLSCPRGCLEAVAEDAERYGEGLLTDVCLQGQSRLSHPARLEVGEAVSTERTTSLPFRLQVEGAGRLLPSMEGNLDVAWLGAGRTYLALSVQYEPAPAVLGQPIDRVLLHRVVEAVALHFVETAAERLAARSSV